LQYRTAYFHATEGNGAGSNAAACNNSTSVAVYYTASIANVASITTSDSIYTDFGVTNFQGGSQWFGISSVLGQAQADRAFFMVNNAAPTSNIQAISECFTQTPTPTPTPTPTSTADIRVLDCAQGTTHDVTLVGASSPPVGFAVKLSGGGGSCPTWNGTQCFEILANTGITGTCTVTLSAATTGGCTSGFGDCPGPTPTPTPTPATPTPTPTPATPTPTPTPEFVFARYLDCDDPTNLLNVYGPYPTTFPNVLKDGAVCYEYDTAAGSGTDGLYTLFTAYNTCLECQVTPTPTPTPVTPTPTPVCNLIVVGQQSTTTGTIEVACYPSKTSNRYFDAATVCAATKMYTDSSCSTLQAGTIYVSEVGVSEYRIWNGTNFTTACTACPPPP
jgi:hypothetical protein